MLPTITARARLPRLPQLSPRACSRQYPWRAGMRCAIHGLHPGNPRVERNRLMSRAYMPTREKYQEQPVDALPQHHPRSTHRNAPGMPAPRCGAHSSWSRLPRGPSALTRPTATDPAIKASGSHDHPPANSLSARASSSCEAASSAQSTSPLLLRRRGSLPLRLESPVNADKTGGQWLARRAAQ